MRLVKYFCWHLSRNYIKGLPFSLSQKNARKVVPSALPLALCRPACRGIVIPISSSIPLISPSERFSRRQVCPAFPAPSEGEKTPRQRRSRAEAEIGKGERKRARELCTLLPSLSFHPSLLVTYKTFSLSPLFRRGRLSFPRLRRFPFPPLPARTYARRHVPPLSSAGRVSAACAKGSSGWKLVFLLLRSLHQKAGRKSDRVIGITHSVRPRCALSLSPTAAVLCVPHAFSSPRNDRASLYGNGCTLPPTGDSATSTDNGGRSSDGLPPPSPPHVQYAAGREESMHLDHSDEAASENAPLLLLLLLLVHLSLLSHLRRRQLHAGGDPFGIAFRARGKLSV